MGRDLIEKDGKFAVRESVSDEEIITPWFDTANEVAEHLITHGDSWGNKPISREAAEAFIEYKYVPTMAIMDGCILHNYDIAAYMKREKK